MNHTSKTALVHNADSLSKCLTSYYSINAF